MHLSIEHIIAMLMGLRSMRMQKGVPFVLVDVLLRLSVEYISAMHMLRGLRSSMRKGVLLVLAVSGTSDVVWCCVLTRAGA